jgi:hypothetical protein
MILKKTKVCACCGREHAAIIDPKIKFDGDALDGYYWNCTCGTTLYAPFTALEDRLE